MNLYYKQTLENGRDTLEHVNRQGLHKHMHMSVLMKVFYVYVSHTQKQGHNKRIRKCVIIIAP